MASVNEHAIGELGLHKYIRVSRLVKTNVVINFAEVPSQLSYHYLVSCPGQDQRDLRYPMHPLMASVENSLVLIGATQRLYCSIDKTPTVFKWSSPFMYGSSKITYIVHRKPRLT